MDQSDAVEYKVLKLIIKIFLNIPGLFSLYIFMGIIAFMFLAQNIQLDKYVKQTVTCDQDGNIALNEWFGEMQYGMAKSGAGEGWKKPVLFSRKRMGMHIFTIWQGTLRPGL